MRITKNKKGYTIADISWVAITLGIGIIVLSVMSQITGEVKSTSCIGSLEQMYSGTCYVCPNSTYSNFFGGQTGGNLCSNTTTFSNDDIYYNSSSNASAGIGGDYSVNISGKGQEGLWKIANWLPTIGLVIGAVIVIVALSVLFTMRFRES